MIDGDIAAPPEALKSRDFHHVIANPPYFEEARRSAAPDEGRELAKAFDNRGGIVTTDADTREGLGS